MWRTPSLPPPDTNPTVGPGRTNNRCWKFKLKLKLKLTLSANQNRIVPWPRRVIRRPWAQAAAPRSSCPTLERWPTALLAPLPCPSRLRPRPRRHVLLLSASSALHLFLLFHHFFLVQTQQLTSRPPAAPSTPSSHPRASPATTATPAPGVLPPPSTRRSATPPPSPPSPPSRPTSPTWLPELPTPPPRRTSRPRALLTWRSADMMGELEKVLFRPTCTNHLTRFCFSATCARFLFWIFQPVIRPLVRD